MEIRHRTHGIGQSLSALLALLLAILLTGCSGLGSVTTTVPEGTTTAGDTTVPLPAPTVEELTARVEASRTAETDCESVTDWITYWEFPAYSKIVLEWIEQRYNTFYVGELGTPREVAFQLAEYFLTYAGEIDLSSENEVTDLLAECYLAAAGDKYAYYMNAESYTDYSSDMDGNYVGIGVQVIYSSIEKTVEIVSVFKNTPALEAGLMAGDLISAVDGTPASELSYYEIIDRVRGEEGSTVVITVDRDGELLTFNIVRAALTQVTVEGRLLTGDDRIGYVRISEFDDTTFEQFRTTVETLLAAGAEAFVFDVRENPGGALTAILDVLDYLVEDGAILASYEYYNGNIESDTASDGHRLADGIPVTVIANSHTASAGELFTCALQDYNSKEFLDVTVVGTVTYGKGTMQSLFLLPGGRATTISNAYYNPPYSGNYEGKGVTPDILSELPEELQNVSIYQLTEENDTQLAAAVAVLAGKLGN